MEDKMLDKWEKKYKRNRIIIPLLIISFIISIIIFMYVAMNDSVNKNDEVKQSDMCSLDLAKKLYKCEKELEKMKKDCLCR